MGVGRRGGRARDAHRRDDGPCRRRRDARALAARRGRRRHCAVVGRSAGRRRRRRLSGRASWVTPLTTHGLVIVGVRDGDSLTAAAVRLDAAGVTQEPVADGWARWTGLRPRPVRAHAVHARRCDAAIHVARARAAGRRRPRHGPACAARGAGRRARASRSRRRRRADRAGTAGGRRDRAGCGAHADVEGGIRGRRCRSSDASMAKLRRPRRHSARSRAPRRSSAPTPSAPATSSSVSHRTCARSSSSPDGRKRCAKPSRSTRCRALDTCIGYLTLIST